MSRGHCVFGAIAFLIAAGSPALAVGRPDFSGVWVSEAGDDIGSGWCSKIAIRQNATTLTIEYVAFAIDDLQPPLRFNYALDGSKTTNSVMIGRGVQAVDSKTEWAGDKFAITTTYPFSNPFDGKPMSMAVRQLLSMLSPGIMVVDAIRSGVMGGPATTTRTTYKKL